MADEVLEKLFIDFVGRDTGLRAKMEETLGYAKRQAAELQGIVGKGLSTGGAAASFTELDSAVRKLGASADPVFRDVGTQISQLSKRIDILANDFSHGLVSTERFRAGMHGMQQGLEGIRSETQLSTTDLTSLTGAIKKTDTALGELRAQGEKAGASLDAQRVRAYAQEMRDYSSALTENTRRDVAEAAAQEKAGHSLDAQRLRAYTQQLRDQGTAIAENERRNTAASAALDNYNRHLATLRSREESTSAAIKRLSNEVASLGSAFTATGMHAEQTVTRLNELRTAAINMGAGFEKGSAEMRAATTVAAQAGTQIANVERRIALTTGGTRELGASLQVLRGSLLILPGPLGQVGYGLTVAERGLSGLAETAGISVGAITGIAAAVAALGVTTGAATNFAANLQQSQRFLEAITGQAAGAYDSLTRSLVGLSTQLPFSAQELYKTATAAAEVGVQGAANIGLFTKKVQELAFITQGSGEQIASDLAKFLNETGLTSSAAGYQAALSDVARALAAVHIETAAADSTITLSRYMAASAHISGITRDQIIGIAGALDALAQRPQAAGSAFVRVLQKMQADAASGGVALHNMAVIAGQTASSFGKLVSTNPEQAFIDLAQGLSKANGQGVVFTQLLDAIGIKNTRDVRELAALAGGFGSFTQALKAVNKAEQDKNLLDEIMNTAMDNLKSQASILANHFGVLAIVIGTPLVNSLTTSLEGINQNVTGWASFGAEVGSVVYLIGALIAEIGLIGVALNTLNLEGQGLGKGLHDAIQGWLDKDFPGLGNALRGAGSGINSVMNALNNIGFGGHGKQPSLNEGDIAKNAADKIAAIQAHVQALLAKAEDYAGNSAKLQKLLTPAFAAQGDLAKQIATGAANLKDKLKKLLGGGAGGVAAIPLTALQKYNLELKAGDISQQKYISDLLKLIAANDKHRAGLDRNSQAWGKLTSERNQAAQALISIMEGQLSTQEEQLRGLDKTSGGYTQLGESVKALEGKLLSLGVTSDEVAKLINAADLKAAQDFVQKVGAYSSTGAYQSPLKGLGKSLDIPKLGEATVALQKLDDALTGLRQDQQNALNQPVNINGLYNFQRQARLEEVAKAIGIIKGAEGDYADTIKKTITSAEIQREGLKTNTAEYKNLTAVLEILVPLLDRLNLAGSQTQWAARLQGAKQWIDKLSAYTTSGILTPTQDIGKLESSRRGISVQMQQLAKMQERQNGLTQVQQDHLKNLVAIYNILTQAIKSYLATADDTTQTISALQKYNLELKAGDITQQQYLNDLLELIATDDKQRAGLKHNTQAWATYTSERNQAAQKVISITEGLLQADEKHRVGLDKTSAGYSVLSYEMTGYEVQLKRLGLTQAQINDLLRQARQAGAPDWITKLSAYGSAGLVSQVDAVNRLISSLKTLNAQQVVAANLPQHNKNGAYNQERQKELKSLAALINIDKQALSGYATTLENTLTVNEKNLVGLKAGTQGYKDAKAIVDALTITLNTLGLVIGKNGLGDLTKQAARLQGADDWIDRLKAFNSAGLLGSQNAITQIVGSLAELRREQAAIHPAYGGFSLLQQAHLKNLAAIIIKDSNALQTFEQLAAKTPHTLQLVSQAVSGLGQALGGEARQLAKFVTSFIGLAEDIGKVTDAVKAAKDAAQAASDVSKATQDAANAAKAAVTGDLIALGIDALSFAIGEITKGWQEASDAATLYADAVETGVKVSWQQVVAAENAAALGATLALDKLKEVISITQSNPLISGNLAANLVTTRSVQHQFLFIHWNSTEIDKQATDAGVEFAGNFLSAIETALMDFNSPDFTKNLYLGIDKVIEKEVIEGLIKASALQPEIAKFVKDFQAAVSASGPGGSALTSGELLTLKTDKGSIDATAKALGKELGPLFKELGLDIGDNTDALAALTATLQNVPQGFKVDLRSFQAATVYPAPPSSGGNLTTQSIGYGQPINVTIVSNDPQVIWNKLQPIIRQHNTRMTGTPIGSAPRYLGG